jgi:hypothetical protein
LEREHGKKNINKEKGLKEREKKKRRRRRLGELKVRFI